MAESKDTHVVEIPIDEEHQQKLVSAIQHHPLMEISQSPGHLLLLKLWQREEDLFGRCMALKETRMDSIKRESCSLLLKNNKNIIPCATIGGFLLFYRLLRASIVIILLVHIKACKYWKVCRQLQRERADNGALTRCIQELRMKEASFNLSKEPQVSRRMKSSSVEIKWRPIT